MNIGKAKTFVLILLILSSAQAVLITADADGFTEGTDISNAFAGITLSSVGTTEGLDGRVYAVTSSLATTGTMVFGHNLENSTAWYRNTFPVTENKPDDYALRIDLDDPANMVSIDMVALNDFCYMYLSAYNSEGIKIGWSGSDGLGYSFGEVLNAQITRDTYDIAYVIVGGVFGNVKSEALLDNFSANVIPEPATILLLALGSIAALRKKGYRNEI